MNCKQVFTLLSDVYSVTCSEFVQYVFRFIEARKLLYFFILLVVKMLDLFTIFSKGGIVLWCFQSTSQIFTPSVNALIRSVILQVSGLFIILTYA